ncbi:DUF4347 domain-containing protein [Leptolyngbya sp. AN02str]|uniref:DUF4347 domain-containing protein n=1 Tax=Leptolyngbya sp. AN02str TaxID=3423363 RepID=UPI003D31A615
MHISSFQHLLLVDPSVSNAQQLIVAVREHVTVVVLEPNQCGIGQISSILATYRDLHSVHVLTHGQPGRLQLGSTALTHTSLGEHATAIAQWSHALAPQAEILLYGCNVAATAEGINFIHHLAELTGAAIAASSTLVGAASLGGNWELDYSTRPITTALAFQEEAIASYAGVLATAFPNLLYANVGNVLYTLDTATGQATQVGTLVAGSAAIARESVTGRVYYITNASGGGNPAGTVAYWDPTTETNTVLSQSGQTSFVKLAQAPNGTIYAATLGSAELFTVNADTGAISTVGTITGGTPTFPNPPGTGDMAFDPNDPNSLIISTYFDNPNVAGTTITLQLYRVNLTTLQATYIGDTGLVGNDGAGSLAFGSDGQLYVTSPDGDGNVGSGENNLYRINLTNGQPTFIAQTLNANGGGTLRFNDFGSLPTPTPTIDIEVTSSDNTTTVTPGQQVTYTITITNNSTELDVINIPVNVTLPPGIINITLNGNPATNNITTEIPGPLTPGQSTTITVIGTVDPTINPNTTPPTTLTTTVTVPPIPGINEPNSGDNTVTDVNTLVPAGTNQPPVTNNTSAEVTPGAPVQIPGISASDPNNDTITSFTIVQLPPTAQGQLFIGNPSQPGAIAITNPNTVITAAQANQLFFQPANGFTGATFTYTATDNRGGTDLTPATVTLSLSDGQCLPGEVINGTANNDSLVGTNNRDTISGFAGNDTIFGGGCPDLINGGDGNDLLRGDSGSDTILGGTGNDIIFAGIGNDVILGEAGNDRIGGGDGNDSIQGGIGQDTLFGFGGNDTLFGGADNDILRGGDGADILQGDAGNDTILGEAGNDVIRGEDGDDLLQSGAGNDTIFAGLGNDVILGEAGNDFIGGGDGNDFIRGGDGLDTLFGLGGNDTLFGGADNDILRGGDGADFLQGDAGNDTILGEVGNDVIRGENGDDLLQGGAGNDTIFAGIGNDVILGDAGNDRIGGGDGNDFVRGGDGLDTLFGFGGNDTLFGGDDNDILRGGDGTDILQGDAGNDTILGEAGNDVIRGGDGADLLQSGVGNDNIFGGIGDDTILGEAGNDRVGGGDGNDFIRGGDGLDTLFGFGGNDTLSGESGNDDVRGGDGVDVIFGGQGNDTLLGENGNDRIRGGIDADVLLGGSGNDTLFGDAGNDVLLAGAGNDVLVGGEGNDTLVSSGGGTNVLTGGPGADRFSFLGINQEDALAQSRVGELDEITGINFEGGDRISFSFTNSLVATNKPTGLFNAGVVNGVDLTQAAIAAFADKNQFDAGAQTLSANEAVFFNWQGVTHLAVNNDNAAFDAGSDFVVKISAINYFRLAATTAGVLNANNYFV